jgi:hypothetical protein
MTKVYIVMASQGEYSDRVEWPIAGYWDAARAEARVSEESTKQREEYEAENAPWHAFRRAAYEAGLERYREAYNNAWTAAGCPEPASRDDQRSYFLYEVEVV